jgi:hypothetical protein
MLVNRVRSEIRQYPDQGQYAVYQKQPALPILWLWIWHEDHHKPHHEKHGFFKK